MTCKDNKRKRHVNEHLRTSLANSGRVAGMGISYDDYAEDSYPGTSPTNPYQSKNTISAHKKRTQEEIDALDGPVITKRLEDCHDSKICRALLKERQRTCQAEGTKESNG